MKPVSITNINQGGIADSDFMGYPNSVSSLVGMDLHSEPGVLRVLQKLSLASGSTVDEFCKVKANCSDGNTYFFSSESGNIWQRDEDGAYSLVHTTTPTDGEAKILSAMEFGGYLYWTTQNWVHRISVRLTDDFTDAEENWQPLNKMDALSRKLPFVAEFDGVDDYATSSANDLALSNDNIFSLSCWFKVDSPVVGGQNNMCIWGTANTASQFQLILGGTVDGENKNRVSMIVGASTVVAETQSNAYKEGEWNHLVYVKNGTGSGASAIYINGVEIPLITDAASTLTTTSCVKYIGARTTTTELFDGQLSSLKIHNEELDATEVTALYEKGKHDTTKVILSYTLNGSWKEEANSVNLTAVNGVGFTIAEDFLDFPFRFALATSLSEAGSAYKPFYASQDTLSKVRLFISDKGTGNWTLTLHDSANVSVDTVAITNANLSEGWMDFNFATPVVLNMDEEYHIHLHSSVADGYVITSNFLDLSDANVELFSAGDLEFHSMQVLNGVLYLGERNYVHSIYRESGIHYIRLGALDIAQPLRIKAMNKFINQLVIGTYVSDNVNKTEIIRWDGWSVSFNVSDTIEETGINAFIPADNYMYVNAGKSGSIYVYDGSRLELVKVIKGDYTEGKQAHIFPEAVATFKGVPIFGFSNLVDNPALQGVYSFGQRTADYPRVLALDYPVSLRGTVLVDEVETEDPTAFVMSDLEIGCITVVNDIILVAWRWWDDVEEEYLYGIDELDNDNKLNGAYFETRNMIAMRHEMKDYKTYYIPYKSLPANTGANLYIKKNHGNYSDAIEFKDYPKRSELEVSKSQMGAVHQAKIQLTSSGNEAPIIEGLFIFPASNN